MILPLILQTKLRFKLLLLNFIPCINAGGCAIVAFNLYKYLRKELTNSKVNIVYAVDKNNTCVHAVVELNGVFYDSSGKITLKELLNWTEDTCNILVIKPKVVKHHLKTKNWNNYFNRAKYEKVILKILNQTKAN